MPRLNRLERVAASNLVFCGGLPSAAFTKNRPNAEWRKPMVFISAVIATGRRAVSARHRHQFEERAGKLVPVHLNKAWVSPAMQELQIRRLPYATCSNRRLPGQRPFY